MRKGHLKNRPWEVTLEAFLIDGFVKRFTPIIYVLYDWRGLCGYFDVKRKIVVDRWNGNVYVVD